MFGNSFFRDFENDPFFSMQQRLQAHSQMMQGTMSPFMGSQPYMMGSPLLGITDGREYQQQQRSRDVERRAERSRPMIDPMSMMMMDPLSMYSNHANVLVFRGMNRMMPQMDQLGMPSVGGAGVAGSPMFQQSSFMSYSNTGDGAPKVYQATSSTRQAPGGVRETTKSVRDSETGVQKMAVGHHIGERGHVQERSLNVRSGEREENEDYININEEEGETFEQEFRQRTSPYSRNRQQGINESRSRHDHTFHQRRNNPDRHVPSASEGVKPSRENDLQLSGKKAKIQKKVTI